MSGFTRKSRGSMRKNHNIPESRDTAYKYSCSFEAQKAYTCAIANHHVVLLC